jgi:hypothetical protein
VAAAYVIGRRALGFEEKLPKGYEALLKDDAFLAHVHGFYGNRLQELQKPQGVRRRTPTSGGGFPGTWGRPRPP